MSSLSEIEQLDRYISVKHRVRPVRIAYIFQEEEHEKAHEILDAIFEHCYSRWGGRRSLIVPIKNNTIDPRYIDWLEDSDPDVIFSYSELSEAVVNEIDKRVFPALFIHNKEKDGPHGIDQRSGVTTVSSLSLLPESKSTNAEILPYLLCSFWRWKKERLITDSFGVANYPQYANGLFTPITLVPEKLERYERIEGEQEKDVYGLFNRLSLNPGVLTLSQLSGKDSNTAKIGRTRWSNSLQMIVGSSIQDRLSFWNAIHLIEESRFFDLPALRIPEEYIEDQSFIEVFAQFLNKWSSRFPGAYSQRNITVRSSSVSEDRLKSFSEKIRIQKYYENIYVQEFAPPFPEERREKEYYFSGYPNVNRINENPSLILPEEPNHFRYIATQFANLKEGAYAVDVSIERYKNHSNVINRPHWWQLPKRAEIVRLFDCSRICDDGTLTFIHSHFKNQSLFQNYSPNQIKISFPKDDTLFRIIFQKERLYKNHDCRYKKLELHIAEVVLSEHGRALQGVLSLFKGLNPAYKVISNRFWREVIESQYSFDKIKEDKEYRSIIQQKLQEEFGKEFSISSDEQWERFAKNIIHKMYHLPKPDKAITYKKLWDKRNRDFRKFLEEQPGHGFNKLGSIHAIKNDFESALKDLVELGIFFQGTTWKCRKCGNQNWVSVDSLRLKNNCSVCNYEHQVNVQNLEWQFLLNDRVGEALYKSAVITELWTLGSLLESARESFYFVPPSNLFRKFQDSEPIGEIDLICIQDGDFIIGEAKYSASGFSETCCDNLIEYAKRVEPKFLLLSFIEKDADLSPFVKKIESAGFQCRVMSPDRSYHNYDPWSHF